MPQQNNYFKRYIIDVYGTADSEQYATIRDEGTDNVAATYLTNPSEIEMVAKTVAANSVFMQSLKDNALQSPEINQIKYIEMIGANLADTILKQSAMIFDPDPRYAYGGERVLQSSNTALQSGDCTYILEHVQFPSLFKIGYTSNLYQRTERLYHENNKLPVKLIAFFKTNRNIELETYLHMAFASYRKVGEWFQYKPIERWINFYKAEFERTLNITAPKNEEIIEPYIW